MTVSRVINGKGYVSAGLREKVELAIRELDYSPNRLARSLKAERTQVVGILLPDLANPFSAMIARGVEDVLIKHGYSAFISSTDQSSTNEEAAVQKFSDHRVDGIVVATRGSDAGDHALRKLAQREIPMVAIGRTFPAATTDHVTADYRKGGYLATQHLIELGHRAIGFVGVSLANGATLLRFQGFLDALRDAGIEARNEWIVGPEPGGRSIYSTQQDGYAAMQQFMHLDERPTAIFTRNDYTAIGVLCGARDAGLSTPGDLSIVGFDNVPLSAYIWPPLTTIDQKIVEQGAAAAQLLLDRMNSSGLASRVVEFDCNLVVRASTAPTTGHLDLLKRRKYSATASP